MDLIYSAEVATLMNCPTLLGLQIKPYIDLTDLLRTKLKNINQIW